MDYNQNKFNIKKLSFIKGFDNEDSKKISKKYPNFIVFSKPENIDDLDISIKHIYKNGISYTPIQGVNSKNNIMLDDNKVSLSIDNYGLLNINKNEIDQRYFYTGAYNPLFKYLESNDEINHYKIIEENINSIANITDENNNNYALTDENNYFIIESLKKYNHIIIAPTSNDNKISYKKIEDNNFINTENFTDNIIILLDKNERLYISALENIHITSTKDFKVYGNLNSTDESSEYYFKGSNLSGLFKGAYVVDASGLTLHETLTENACYQSMFEGCRLLENTPKLPAETLTESCYESMFKDCTSLINVPENLLPATTLADSCYAHMFEGCENLITTPKLDVEILTESCYELMFADCKKLTAAPELPATKLVKDCYKEMFNGCEKLNYITVNFDNIFNDEEIHDYVEIGGVKWATMNVGATSITDTGLYFQWGDTKGYTASQVGSGAWQKAFKWADYKYCNGTSSVMTKYNTTDNKIVLEAGDDAVHITLGGTWRMPTTEEFQALLDATTNEWIYNYQDSGINGRLFTDNTNHLKTLFFPAVGYCSGSIKDAENRGYYWASSLGDSSVTYGCNLFLNSNDCDIHSSAQRYLGYTVRGVLGNVIGVTLNKSSLSLNKSESETLIATVLPTTTSNKQVTWSSSDTNVATVDNEGNVTGVDNGNATITVTTEEGGFTAQCAISVHEWVEIAGIKWATMNIGANSITDTGLYFQWGDTQGYTASQVGNGEGQKYFGWKDYKYGNGTSNPGTVGMTKYNSADGKTILEASDDAAQINWGGSWRMPTRMELFNLYSNTTTSFTNNYQNTGVAGLVCTSNDWSGTQLFFPANGSAQNGSIVNQTTTVGCWSNNIYAFEYEDPDDDKIASTLAFSTSTTGLVGTQDRYVGLAIRGVLGSVTGVTLNKSSLSLNKSESETLIATVLPTTTSNKQVTWSSSDTNVATVDNEGNVTGVDNGNATITVTTEEGGFTAQCAISVHEWVEIGGVKWATMNVGATSITDAGLYFQWGDTKGYTASQVGNGEGQKYFGWKDYKYGNGTDNPNVTDMSKYASDGKTILEASDDAVQAAWGSSWRMPTTEEFQALGDAIENNVVRAEWTQINGVNGLLCTDNSDESKTLFFPAAGYCNNDSVEYVNEGYYWGSSLFSNNVNFAWDLTFHDGNTIWDNSRLRNCGFVIRGVFGSVTGVTLNKSSLSLNQGAIETLVATVLPTTTSNTQVTWSSSDSHIVNVDSEGKITANNIGNATITVTTKEGGFTDKCIIKVHELTYPYTENWVNRVALEGTFISNGGWEIRNEDGSIKNGVLGESAIPERWMDENGDLYDNDVIYVNKYLTIECTEGILQLGWGMTNYNIDYAKPIEYSLDSENWTEISSYNNGSYSSFPELSVGNKLYIRGNNESYSDDICSSKLIQIGTGKFKVYGNIMSLFYKGDFIDKIEFPENSNYNLCNFFSNTNVETANFLMLPPKTITIGCYKELFKNCEELTAIFTLPAKTLAQSCYESMFEGCTSLESYNRILHAKILNNSCYKSMFAGCTSLKNMSYLPATTLTQSCYEMMFKDCTSLENAPELRATTLSSNCYAHMFEGCTKLKNIPELPIRTLAKSCYESMFNGCTSLTTAPELPATTLANSCYAHMFEGCKKLTVIPKLDAQTLAESCYESMFNGCTSLTNVLENLLPVRTLSKKCYTSMFNGCTNLIVAPELPATTLADSCYAHMFEGCKLLTSAPKLDAETLTQSCYESMFNGCNNLTTITELGATTLATNCYKSMFQGCTSLTNIPENLLSIETLAESCYESMFKGCTTLETAPILPATNLSYEENGEIKTADNCYVYMFEGCTSLTTAPDLPATTLAESCYAYMFKGCTSLTSVPVLSVETLADSCYVHMFEGCTSLDYIKYNGVYDESCFTNWLNNVAPSGTFVNLKEDNGIELNSVNGIPENWTIYDFSSGCIIINPLNSGTLTLCKGNYIDTQIIKCYSNKSFDKSFEFDENDIITDSIKTSEDINIDLTNRDIVIIKSIEEHLTSIEESDTNTFINFEDITNNEKSLNYISSDSDFRFNILGNLNNNENYFVTIKRPENQNELNVLTDFKYNLLMYLFIDSNVIDASKLTLFNNLYEYTCYKMFKDCTLLENAPILPAETLAESCYKSMFEGCTSLTAAPILPAETLVERCYELMFKKCSNLKYIKALFTDIGLQQITNEQFLYPYTTHWVNDVAQKGTFIKNDDWDIYTEDLQTVKKGIIGISGIPKNWMDENGKEYKDELKYEEQYLTLECTSNSSDIEITLPQNVYFIKISRDNTDNIGDINNWRQTLVNNLSITLKYKDKIYLKGYNVSYDGNDINKKINTFAYKHNSNDINNGTFKVYGNIMSLFYGDNFANNVKFSENTNYNLCKFFANTYVNDLSNLILPATELTESCYESMFEDCTLLTATPKLPAETLTTNCYKSMFKGCISLQNGIKLPATTLAESCYEEMFYACTSLRYVYPLRANVLAKRCYASMFEKCINLSTAPKFNAIKLANECCKKMFYNCHSLNFINWIEKFDVTNVIDVLDNDKVNNCFNEWLSGDNDDNGDYLGCDTTGIFVNISDNNFSNDESGTNGWTVYNSSNVPLIIDPLEDVFKVTIIKNLPNIQLDRYSVKYYINNGNETSGTPIDDGNASQVISIDLYENDTFLINEITISANETISNSNRIENLGYYLYTYQQRYLYIVCEKSFNIMGNINIIKYTYVNIGDAVYNTHNIGFAPYLFSSTNVVDASKLILKSDDLDPNFDKYLYAHMFEGCISLEKAPKLPTTTLAESCYESMFADCKKLTEAPELPGKILAKRCYAQMFAGCKNLTYIRYTGDIPDYVKNSDPDIFRKQSEETMYCPIIIDGIWYICHSTVVNYLTLPVLWGRKDDSTDTVLPFYNWLNNASETGTLYAPNFIEENDKAVFENENNSTRCLPENWNVINLEETEMNNSPKLMRFSLNSRAARFSTLNIETNGENENVNGYCSELINNEDNKYPTQAFIMMPVEWENELSISISIFKDDEENIYNNYNIFNKSLFKPLKQNIILDDECKYNIYSTQFTCNKIMFKENS